MVDFESLAEIPLEGEDEGSGLDWHVDLNPCCRRIQVDLREWSDVVGSTFVEIATVDSTYGYYSGRG